MKRLNDFVHKEIHYRIDIIIISELMEIPVAKASEEWQILSGFTNTHLNRFTVLCQSFMRAILEETSTT